jgi:hypothetical protein
MTERIKFSLEEDGITTISFDALVERDYEGGQQWVLDRETNSGGHGDTHLEAAINYLKYKLCPGSK